MIIIMASRSKEDVDYVIQKVEDLGYRPHVIEGVERTVIAAVGGVTIALTGDRKPAAPSTTPPPPPQ